MESFQIVIQVVLVVSDIFDCVIIFWGEDEKVVGDGNNFFSVCKCDLVFIWFICFYNFKVWFCDRWRVDGDIVFD